MTINAWPTQLINDNHLDLSGMETSVYVVSEADYWNFATQGQHILCHYAGSLPRIAGIVAPYSVLLGLVTYYST